VYIPQLGRSIPKRSLQAIHEHRDLRMRMICVDAECCPPGGGALLRDARAHAIVQRARNLDEVARIERPVWRFATPLAGVVDDGLDLAKRINRRAQSSPAMSQVDTRALIAISAVSHTRRVDVRSRRVA
jgi:hypothetical protein